MPTTFDRYLALVTLRALGFTASGLCGLLTLFGFVAELALVGRGRFDTGDALWCAILEAPARLLQVAPVSMLLACLLGLGGLARQSELVALRGLGLSQLRIMRPALLLVLPASLLLLALSQFVIPGGEQAARQLRVAAMVGTGAGAGTAGETLWARGPGVFLEVGGFGDGLTPQGVSIYRFRADNTLRDAVDADWAEIRPDGGWLLHGVERHAFGHGHFTVDRLDTLPWRPFLSRRELRFLAAPPNSVPAIGLLRHIRALERQGQPALRYRRELWARIAVPVSMFGLVLSAAPLLFGAPRGRTAGTRLAAGIGIAIGFSLLQEIMERVGVLLELPPAVQALTAPVLLVALTLWLLAAEPR